MSRHLTENRPVIDEISPRDVMYKSGGPDQYFFWGGQALKAVERFMALVNLSAVTTILDLPSGYGRVLRFLRAAFPDAVIAACDIDRDAVDFCAGTFDAQPIYSTVDLRTVPLHDSYDLIWCGSLLTHIHADQWREVLRLFSAHLSDAGLLVFTTHGRPNVDRLRSKNELGLSDWAVTAILSDYERFGFGYQNFSGRDGYGISLSSASWVCSQIFQTDGLRLAGYQEGGWGGLQDAVACVNARRALR
jgi:SAM-dependent methyltransferase